ncbi:MAG: hypothetical protein FJ045_00735 [Crenarchaeota archaeon]|nr:hypothetical protein [Thermoproteota archaeon]
MWKPDLKQWTMDSLAGALVVAGKSSITKEIYFHWTADNEMPFETGNYVVTFCAWIDNEEFPSIKSSHKFAISPTLLNSLQKDRTEGRVSIQDVTPADSFPQNEIMAECRLKKLLDM